MATTEKTDNKNDETLCGQPPVMNTEKPPEFGGPQGLEPTRYGDWERKGRCIDF